MFSCKPYEVDMDMPIFPASVDDTMGMDHFLVEPVCKEDWVGGLLDLDALQIEKCFNIEDIASTFDCDQIKSDTDAAHTKITEGDRKSPEFPSEVLQILNTGVQEECLLDGKHADKACSLDQVSCKEPRLKDVKLEHQSPTVHKRESDDDLVDFSSPSIPLLEYTNNYQSSLLHQVAAGELHETFSNMPGHETLSINNIWQKKHDLYDLESYVELDNSLNCMKFDVTSSEHEGEAKFSSIIEFSGSTTGPVTGALNRGRVSGDHQMKRKRLDGCESVKTSNSDVSIVEFCSSDGGDDAGALVSPKRSRKPPRRYIEESLEYHPKSHSKKCGIGKKSRERVLPDRFQKFKWQKVSHAEQTVYEDDSFNVGCIQVPFGLPMEKENSKRSKSSLVQFYGDCKDNRLLDPREKLEVEPLSVESQDDISEDECATKSCTPKGSSRRKRHISWTSEEVVKLVEGVSKCGVGRWTEIKRLLFSSASHRTSVDLKDKWRNLLRASCNQLQLKEKVEQGRKQASNYIPESILWRVRELAVIYPYPRDSRSKSSCTVPAVSSFSSNSSNALVPLSTVV
ncbi:hypothetical protein UlMin_028911 [Ulmus minor]